MARVFPGGRPPRFGPPPARIASFITRVFSSKSLVYASKSSRYRFSQ
jgi:hypothetical protein